MSAHTRVTRAALAIVAFSLSIECASALTMRERRQAERLRWEKLSVSICDGCGPKPVLTRQVPKPSAPKQYAALVDPVAALERSSRVTARFLAGDTSTTTMVPAPAADRTLASVRRRPSRSYAQALARRRYAKLVRARRYAAVLYRRKAQAAARAAANSYRIEFGRLGRILE